ncbi:hypothetical protein ACJJTC_006208 [Scirpophaga incertulas]
MLTVLCRNFTIQLSSKHTHIFLKIPHRIQSCNQCGFRLFSSYKDVRFNENLNIIKHRINKIKPRYLSSHINTEKNSEIVNSTKENSELDSSKKITVKLKKTELKRLLTLAEPEKWTLAGAISFLLVSSSVTMAVPFSLGKVLDIIYNSTNDLGAAREKLDTLCLMLCGVFLIGGLWQRMTQALRKQVYSAIMRQETAWFGKTSTGELVNRLSADTQLVGRNLSENVSDGLRSLFMVGAGTGMMFYMSPSLALIGLCVVPPVSMLAVVYGRFVRGITRQLQDTLAETSALAEEKISNIKTVKAFSKEKEECESYAKKIENLLKLAYKESLAVGSFYGMTGLSGNTIIILVLYYGGGMVATEQLTVGNLTSFLLYAAYVGISIGGLSNFYTQLNKGMGAATRLWQIVDREPSIPVSGGLRPVERPKGEIVLENIWYNYEGAPLIKGLELHLLPGKSIALVGRSGCGKSTIASLILRLYDPEKGRILLDGVDIRKLDPIWLRSHIGYVSQEPVLFNGSIKENILYGASENYLGEDMEKKEPAWLVAAKTAHLHDMVVANREGWQRQVGARGGQLSGGQKQRVAIARAIVKIVHVLTIAHRLSTIQSADEVCCDKENGMTLLEKGTYTELMSKQKGFFRDFITHQTFGFKIKKVKRELQRLARHVSIYQDIALSMLTLTR